jgi:hypothetical protein
METNDKRAFYIWWMDALSGEMTFMQNVNIKVWGIVSVKELLCMS